MTYVVQTQLLVECMKRRLLMKRPATAMTRKMPLTVCQRTFHAREKKKRTWYMFATMFLAKVIKHSVFLKLTL